MSSTLQRAPRAPGPPPAVAAGPAALFGVLAVGAAVAAGHLVAGIISPDSSPYLAVGNAVIRLAPQGLIDFAKTAFGTADKPVLLAGMAVVIAAIAAGAGLASRRTPTPAVVVVTVLGVIGLVAVAGMPTFAPLDVVAPLVSVAVGVFVMRRLHALAVRADAPRSLHNPAGVSRRTVLGASAAVGAGAVVAGGVGALIGKGTTSSQEDVTARLAAARIAQPAPPIPATAAFPESGTPTFLTAAADFYRIDTALRIPRLNASDWRLRIHGMVDKEIMLTFDDLMNRPLVERPITMTCVSNPLGGDLISTANFIGVDLRALLMEAGVQPAADQAFATSVDGWYTGTPVDVLLEPDRGALLAVGMNGAALPPEHGFPVRMVVPGLYGYVSATKWITDLELTTFSARDGYWYERGWSQMGPVKTGSRIDAPRAGASVPSGRVTAAGIAWSQPDGISRVEVSVDGGPWRDADLATDVSGDTWRMWRTDLNLPPGSHTLQCRATTGKGVTQTATYADVVPDGASGWPAVPFTVV